MPSVKVYGTNPNKHCGALVKSIVDSSPATRLNQISELQHYTAVGRLLPDWLMNWLIDSNEVCLQDCERESDSKISPGTTVNSEWGGDHVHTLTSYFDPPHEDLVDGADDEFKITGGEDESTIWAPRWSAKPALASTISPRSTRSSSSCSTVGIR